MNDTKLLPDDPKLTAYALGELSGDERAAVEAALRENPALRGVVDEVRATAGELEAALAAEAAETAAPIGDPASLPPAAPLNGHAVLVPLDAGETPAAAPAQARPARQEPDAYPARRRGGLFAFPRFYYVVGGLAAACFAVMVVLYRDAYDAKQQLRVAQQREKAARAALPHLNQIDVAVREPKAPELAPAPARPAGGDQLVFSVEPATPRVASESPVPAAPAAPPPDPAAAARPPEIRIAIAPGSTGTGGSDAVTPAAGNAEPKARELPAAAVSLGGTIALAEKATAPAGGDVVTLQPFEVSASREGSALALASAATRFVPAPPPEELPAAPVPQFATNTEAYAYTQDNDFLGAASNPLSTFAVDVDTASYANVRRIIDRGTLPPRDAVRVEELLNYFPYRYPAPAEAGDSAPFAASLEVAEAPWAPQHRLVRIGLKAREIPTHERGPANLVFLLDVSGSMNAANKLPLVKESMRLLLSRLRDDDRVAIVTYAGNSGLALPSTPVARSRAIFDALDSLTPGGSTNGAMGIQLAYDIARANLMTGGVNRVILCTDGDFNVGTTSEGELVRLIEEKARSGVFLTVLGFGMGNLKDATLERLADKGNGHYGYIDTRREAVKLLVEEVSSTLVTIAKDVKIQVEFNPAKVSRYRLIGYENRVLKKEDFNNDNVDAGEIGAGHAVTALYEIVPVGVDDPAAPKPPPVDDLKYQARGAVSTRLEMPMPEPKRPPGSDELLTVKVRYKKPDAFFSQKLEFPLKDRGLEFAKASADFRFAAAVAQFGMILRGSPYKGSATIGDVIAWAATAAASPADDPGGYRGEFIDLARKAARMVR